LIGSKTGNDLKGGMMGRGWWCEKWGGGSTGMEERMNG
jgi:hypothetical protein